MIAKENYNFYNQSDIFNVKPKIDRKQFQTTITQKAEAKNKKKDLNITADNISPSRTFRHLKSTHTPTNKSRNIPIKTENITQDYHILRTHTTQTTINYTNKSSLKKEDDLSNVILDTSAEARKEFTKNLNRVHHDKVVLGTDRPSYTTTNSVSQEYAKKQCKKARMLQPNKVNPPFKPQKPVGKKELNFTTNNTTNTKFNANENATSNKMNFHKSNIFNDPEKEKKNLNLKPNNPKENKNNKKPEVTPTRKRIVDDEAGIPSVDWRYNRTDIILKKSKTKMEFKTARERKLHDNKGAFPCKYDDYVPPVQQDEKRDKSVDDLQKEKYKHIGEDQRKPESFVIENIAMNDNFDMQTIKKVYRNNGLHIFGDRMDPMFMNGKVKGNAKFKVRKNNDDNLYEKRIKKAEEKIEREQGIKIIKKEDDDSEKQINKQSSIKTEPEKQKNNNEKDFRKKGNPKWMEIKIKDNAKKNQFKIFKKSSKD